jgi:hypothetical protein
LGAYVKYIYKICSLAYYSSICIVRFASVVISFHKSNSNPADILPVSGIPKLVNANEEAVAAAWLSLTVPPLIIGISIFGYCLKFIPVDLRYLMIL